MGHIKIAKADGAFDIASADGVIAVKLDTGKVEISYSGSTKTTIESSAGSLDQDDVQTVINAIDVMDGASGPAPLTTLSEIDITIDAATL